MGGNWTRRYFLGVGAGSAASLGLGGSAQVFAKSLSPLRGRFLTHVSVVRVNQIEVTPDRSIGSDEAADNSPTPFAHGERLSRGAAREAGCPGRLAGWL